MLFIVMRHPVLMEDNGRPDFMETFTTLEAARAWIAAQGNEYFKPADYYVVEMEK